MFHFGKSLSWSKIISWRFRPSLVAKKLGQVLQRPARVPVGLIFGGPLETGGFYFVLPSATPPKGHPQKHNITFVASPLGSSKICNPPLAALGPSVPKTGQPRGAAGPRLARSQAMLPPVDVRRRSAALQADPKAGSSMPEGGPVSAFICLRLRSLPLTWQLTGGSFKEIHFPGTLS